MDLGDVSEALDDCLVPCNIDDIDSGDYNNPQLCAEYVNEIMRYLRAMEVSFPLETLELKSAFQIEVE